MHGFMTPGFDPSSAYRPRVWTGGENPDAGLLGFQAPAADGLDETFSIPSIPDLPSAPSASLKGKHAYRPIPHLPTEIHLQIISELLSSRASSCSFCHLAQTATLSTVSVLHHSILQPHLYSTLDLRFANPCAQHHHLSSLHSTLEARLPLLLRTLKSRSELAETVKTIHLPPGGLSTFLTCHLEKLHLPALLRLCPNLQQLTGAADLLSRQFFAGEHYCLDDRPQQHGELARAITTARSLRTWTWNNGNTAGSDWWGRIFDFHPAAESTNFARMHHAWPALESLTLTNIWGLDAAGLTEILHSVPNLRQLSITNIRKKRLGAGMDTALLVAAMAALPAGVRELTIGGIAPAATRALADALAERYTPTNQLEKLHLLDSALPTDILRDLLLGISVAEAPARGFDGRSFLPLLEVRRRRWSVVRELGVRWRGDGEEVGLGGFMYNVEIVGLVGLEWAVVGAGRGVLEGVLEACRVQRVRVFEGVEGCEGVAERGGRVEVVCAGCSGR